MTIKHLGGIFGRNPTFNEVNVDGNIIMANGSGIDFSATSGTGTSELFDDYEEGTWTPSVTGGSISGTCLYFKSPIDRDRFKFPLTLPNWLTKPPAAVILFISVTCMGL